MCRLNLCEKFKFNIPGRRIALARMSKKENVWSEFNSGFGCNKIVVVVLSKTRELWWW